LNKSSNFRRKSEGSSKRAKAHGPVQRDTKAVMADLVAKLSEKLDPQPGRASAGKERQRDVLRPNLDRLTMGVDLGDRLSSYCILGLEGETLAEGQLRTTQEDVAEFFQAFTIARVVMEVGTHSAWVREVVAGCGHEVLVANPRQMEGPKRRKRKNDRIDAHRLARVGRVDLVPKQEDSGEIQPQLRISKAGDVMLRRLLVGSAHYILGPFGPDTDLRRYGLRLCERGGKNAKKRAAVAVARKLAILLHQLWVSGEVYEPLRHASPVATVQEAA
jgi:Transposase